MGNREGELQQAINRVKQAITAENEARAATLFHMNLLRANFHGVKDYLQAKEGVSETAPDPQKVEVSSVDGLAEEVRLLFKAQAPNDDIRPKSAEVQEAISQ